VSQPCIVLVASPDLLPALAEIVGDGELLTFTDADALRALEAITNRRPAVIALERVFAATPRGTALINRIKADPTLKHSEIRVVSCDSSNARTPAPRPRLADGPSATASAVVIVTAPVAPVAPAPQLDQRGTRRAARFNMAGQVDVLIDGNQASLINISTVGAQVVSAAVLKPNQRLRMALPDEQGDIKFGAVVAWASFENSAKSGPRYRAGIEFMNANAAAVDAYSSRHKAT
jgi:PilZ domain-containing protein